MKFVAGLCSLLISIELFAGNWGHRAGGDIFTHLPENSISSLRSLCQSEYQKSSKLKYLEFDIRESLDHQLFIFHDRKTKRKTPIANQSKQTIEYLEEKYNGKYQSLEVSKLDIEDLLLLNLYNSIDEKIPIFESFLDEVLDCGFYKPVVIEVKELGSTLAKEYLFQKTSDFKAKFIKKEIVFEDSFDFYDEQGLVIPVAIMGFKSSVEKSFGKIGSDEFRYWCQRSKDYGLSGIYKVGSHKNLCE
ncbi:MAG: glycerophosphodiester phosphodiesterase family protein [Bdellovibrionota bacterium]|nr:glycerophosphodiester phosphodiesterase family protein [Bdellovibrionota bacterium]